MDFSFSIELEDDKVARLKSLLGRQNEESVADALSSIAKAILCEHLDHLCHSRPMGTATEIRDSKVYFLIRYHFACIPSDIEISRVTGLTVSASRSSIKNVTDRYGLEISQIIKDSIMGVLDLGEQQVSDFYDIKCPSQALVDKMNQDLMEFNDDLEMIYQKSRFKGVYIIKHSSMERLKEKYGER